MKSTIILVDDNDEFLEACSEALKYEGFEVAAFMNVNDAKGYLGSVNDVSSIYAIVSDMIMGPVNGLQFLEFVKSSPRFRPIDFFFLTGTTVELFEPSYRQFHVTGTIQKPCSAAAMIATLKKKKTESAKKMSS